MKKILVLHGPNLNMLGRRETDIYGNTTLNDINTALVRLAQEQGVLLETFQSNHEGEIIDYIQTALGKIDGVIINPAAFTHSSIALRDALLLLDTPIIEVHISNIYRREEFRRHSYIADIATGQITGLGVQGYLLALEAMIRLLIKKDDIL